MKYAIIAAGNGSRLVEEQIEQPKPLVSVAGETLVARLLRVFMAHGATEIHVICNEHMPEVAHYLRRIQQEGLCGKPVPLHVVVKSTPSSMHSFYELSPWLEGDEPFVLTTVDTVFREEEFGAYVSAFREACAGNGGTLSGLMAVTDYVDDEKPLYVDVADDGSIAGFYDTAEHCRYVSGGIYGLTPRCLDTLRACVSKGESRMRNFQRALIADGLRLRAWRFDKIMDIDHRSDIAKAEAWLSE